MHLFFLFFDCKLPRVTKKSKDTAGDVEDDEDLFCAEEMYLSIST